MTDKIEIVPLVMSYIEASKFRQFYEDNHSNLLELSKETLYRTINDPEKIQIFGDDDVKEINLIYQFYETDDLIKNRFCYQTLTYADIRFNSDPSKIIQLRLIQNYLGIRIFQMIFQNQTKRLQDNQVSKDLIINLNDLVLSLAR